MKMKIVPIMCCKDMKRAITFYTTVLDFKIKYPEDVDDQWVVDLIDGEAEIQLTSLEGNQRERFAVNVWVDDVDAAFQYFLSRGLDISNKKGSPVHQSPIDQTWGLREVYVDDPDGNTLRFTQYPK